MPSTVPVLEAAGPRDLRLSLSAPLISYRFGHFGPGSAETDITVLSFRLAKRGRALDRGRKFLLPNLFKFGCSQRGFRTFVYFIKLCTYVPW